MRVHELKTWPVSFAGILSGEKTHEWRRDDRAFNVGDVLHLREWDNVCKTYTSRDAWRLVTWKTEGGNFGVPLGWCVLSIQPCDRCGEVKS